MMTEKHVHVFDSRMPRNPQAGQAMRCLECEELVVLVPDTTVTLTVEESERAWKDVAKIANDHGVSTCDACREMFPSRSKFEKHLREGGCSRRYA